MKLLKCLILSLTFLLTSPAFSTKLYLKPLTTKAIELTTDKNTTLGNIRSQASKKLKISTWRIQIIHVGRMLKEEEDHKLLSTFNIENETTIHVVIKNISDFFLFRPFNRVLRKFYQSNNTVKTIFVISLAVTTGSVVFLLNKGAHKNKLCTTQVKGKKGIALAGSLGI